MSYAEMFNNPTLTVELFKCNRCGEKGQALAQLVTDWVPYGDTTVPMETIDGPFHCQVCGSDDLEELEVDELV